MIRRITSRRVFAELASRGQRHRSGPVRLTYHPQPGPEPRLAFAFGRRFGNAVERNRARRRLRAAFVESWSSDPGPGGAYLLSGSRRVLSAPYADLLRALSECFAQIVPATPSERALS